MGENTESPSTSSGNPLRKTLQGGGRPPGGKEGKKKLSANLPSKKDLKTRANERGKGRLRQVRAPKGQLVQLSKQKKKPKLEPDLAVQAKGRKPANGAI